MDIAPIAASSATLAITRHLQANAEIQMAVMKQLVESQQQMAEMLQALGVGQHVDIQA